MDKQDGEKFCRNDQAAETACMDDQISGRKV